MLHHVARASFFTTALLTWMTMTGCTNTPHPSYKQPFHAYAPTPPMGWNSWDCFGTAVTEEQTKQNADYMAEKLLAHGWKLITVDIQWYEPNAKFHDYVKGAKLIMDEFGRLQPATNKFPSAANGQGFKLLADYCHKKGLTFGIHLMRGIPRQAVEQNTKILGTDLHARDIANVKDTCPWNPDMYGVDMTRPGAQAYYDSVFQLISEWDVDFVKVDDLSRPYFDHQPEIEAIRKAIDNAVAKTGRSIILSTSPGETPIEAGAHVVDHANLWRISDDFWDRWDLLLAQFERCNKWSKYTGPGHYPDADMLALGNIRVGQQHPWTNFTKDEQLTHMTLWMIAKSPLIFGGHLPGNDDWTLSLMTNDEVIAANQAGLNPRQLSREGDEVIWVSDVPGTSEKYVALFNTGSAEKSMTLDAQALGLSKISRVRDLWAKRDVAETTFTVASHGSRLLKVR